MELAFEEAAPTHDQLTAWIEYKVPAQQNARSDAQPNIFSGRKLLTTTVCPSWTKPESMHGSGNASIKVNVFPIQIIASL